MPTQTIPVQTIVFDLDDTIYIERRFVESGFEAVGRVLAGADMSAADWRGAFLAEIERHGSGRVFNTVLAAHGVEPSRARIAELVDIYRHHAPRIAAMDGIPALLDELERRGVGLALITDGPARVQHAKLRALGLAGRFNPTICSSDLAPERAAWKPSPRPFLEVQEVVGQTGAALCYVGDNPRKDFQGARECGWRTVRLRVNEQLHGELETPAGVTEVDSVPALRRVLLEMTR